MNSTPCSLFHSYKFLSFRLVRNLSERIPDAPPNADCGNDTQKINVQIMDALRYLPQGFITTFIRSRAWLLSKS
jgi:hypothetical protein